MAAAPTRHPAAMYPHLPSSKGPQIRSCHVAVIGAGAAALVAARELCREGHKVVAFESGDSVGGTWVYSPSVDSDPLGLDPYRKKLVQLTSLGTFMHLQRKFMCHQDLHLTNSQRQRSLAMIMWLHSMIESAHDDGTVAFRDGSSVLADVILHRTGYKYDFPFLKVNGAPAPDTHPHHVTQVVTVDDNRVGPLYKHIFPPLLAPSLSFIGLPWRVTPFPMFEMQSKWVASVLSRRLALPSQEEMMMDVEAFYSKLDAAGIPKRYTHKLSVYQLDYIDELAAECGYPAVEEWRKQMFVMSLENKVARPESYRDEWDDRSLVLQAHESFQRYCKASIRKVLALNSLCNNYFLLV
ncbi:hypothetical protein AAC387_Pa08g0377 [Persea americana]